MAGFIRRYGFFPGSETITLIEGVIIVDLPPPGAVNGVGTGTVGLVGEFPDMTYAVAVDSSGVVTTRPAPVEVFSGQDMLEKVGGFDSTLGNTGNNGGNGFIQLRNKKFRRLVLIPVNLASGHGGRLWRDLPTNLSSSQAKPVVPMQGGVVEAGREFRSAANRVKLAKRIVFSAFGHFKNGTDGAVTGTTAASFAMTSAAGGFNTARADGTAVKVGDVLVLGVIGAAGAQGGNAGTYRVSALNGDTSIQFEKMDGSSFTLTTGTSLVFRIHPGSDADSAGVLGDSATAAQAAGYRVPCRALDAAIAAATNCTPASVPSAATATTWDPLSGLALRSNQGNGFTYTAVIQASNAANDATLDALYATAIDSLLGDASPARDVNVLITARTSSTLRNKMKAHVLAASENGVGRTAVISPGLQTVSLTNATADADPGVGANRHERLVYSWPGAQTFIPEAVGISQGAADGTTVTDGIIDTPGDGWLAAVLSNLPPERNPGQAAEPVPTVLAPILGFQRGLSTLGMSEYISMRQNGICGLRMDRTAGPIFQSGVTTSLISGQKNINRRRMADFIQDSVSQRLVQFAKLPLTNGLKDTVTGEIDAFLNELKSPNNPPAQRITDYIVDDKSGNTPDLEAKGIYVVIARVRTLATADFIVLQTEVGEGVKITTT